METKTSIQKTLFILSLFFIYSCNVSNDRIEGVTNQKKQKAFQSQHNMLQANGLSFYLLDLNFRIGYKLNEQLFIENLDTINLLHQNGDTTIKLSNLRIIYDSAFQTAYLNFKGIGTLTDTTKGKYLYHYMIPLTIVDNGSQDIVTKPPRVEHLCKSWEAPLIDLILGCNCCDMLWKDGLIIGCTCKCTWGICMYEKKIITENPINNPNFISSTIIRNIKEK